MALFEFVLIILLCVLVSTVLDKFVRHVSLPVLQIIVGFVAVLVIPSITEVREVESELFLVLFIAPLLFNETRTANVRELWQNKASILSLAIGLVVASVLAVGYVLNWLVPSIPLAAAFALGAALGPTDAAAVGALKSQVNLSERQRTLLSGESLINDASGVVAFQFSVAAAVTGAFSLASAVGSFLVLFVGGILVGIVLGFALSGLSFLLGHFGFEDATAHAFYELLSPFVIYLLAEALGVSGILAVVAGGIVMARQRPTFHSTFESRRKLVSDSLWDVVEMLINGILFVMLGMQLPHVLMPGLTGLLATPQIIGVIVAITATSLVCRFVWLLVLEAFHYRSDKEGLRICGGVVRDALVTTIAGAKGAVTLSIILTLPYATSTGAPFPQRDLIVTLAAGTILLTLVLADTLLPRLAPMPADDGSHERELADAELAVREATTTELIRFMDEPGMEMYVPALRLVISQYQVRTAMDRLNATSSVSAANQTIEDEEYRLQIEKLEQLHQRHLKKHDEADWQLHLRALTGIRRSVGYEGRMAGVISGKARHALGRTLRRYLTPNRRPDQAEFDRVYAQSCMYALELEYVSIDLFDRYIAEGTPDEVEAARVRKQTHELSVKSIWSRLNYGQDVPLDSSEAYMLPYDPATGKFTANFAEQFQKAREYAKDVRENALRIELDEITQLQAEGTFSRSIGNELREEVYLLQMSEE